MNYNETGINVDGIDTLILDIYNYAEKIAKSLDEIASLVDATKNFYICDEGDSYRQKFENFKTNFSIVNNNIESYANDLIRLKNRYDKFSSEIKQNIKLATINIEGNMINKYEE